MEAHFRNGHISILILSLPPPALLLALLPYMTSFLWTLKRLPQLVCLFHFFLCTVFQILLTPHFLIIWEKCLH